MNELLLKLSNLEFIKIIADGNINLNEIDFYWNELQAYFLHTNKICIGEQTAGVFFENFIKRLQKTINNKLQLHESIIKNLGFMENEYCHELPHEKPQFVMVPTSDGTSNYWIGLNYQVWRTYNGTNPRIITWLYNDSDGNIILEITPLYKWSFFPDNLEDPDFITYDEFMKNYKPLIHRVIPREIAITWLAQAMEVYKSFFASEEDFIRACKENNW